MDEHVEEDEVEAQLTSPGDARDLVSLYAVIPAVLSIQTKAYLVAHRAGHFDGRKR